MSIGIWQVVIIGVIVVLLFGRGKISEVMGDVAKGIKSFKKGMAEDEADEKPSDPKVLDNDQPTTTARSETESRRVG